MKSKKPVSIRPVSDIRNHFAEISKIIHENNQPIILTKQGYADMVVMSIEQFDNMQFDSEVFFKLKEAEREAEATGKRYSSKEILSAIKSSIGEQNV